MKSARARRPAATRADTAPGCKPEGCCWCGNLRKTCRRGQLGHGLFRLVEV